MLTKFISGCRMVWDLICGTSRLFKSKTEKVTAGGKSAILPNWCCLLFIIVLSGYPCKKRKKIVSRLFLLLYLWKLVLVAWKIKVFNCQHFCGKILSKSLLDSFQFNRRKLVLVAGSTIKIRFSACTCSRCSRALL